MSLRSAPPPYKKRKIEPSSYQYKTPSEIRHVFKAESEAGLVEGLTALRNQLTVKSNEPPVQANDERLLLAKAWLDEDSGAQELFSVWGAVNARQVSLLTVIVGLLSALVIILSTHHNYHAYAQPILRALLSQQWSQYLNQYLAGQHTDLVLATLKLYNSLANYAGGRERKAVLEMFAWEMKSLPKLLHMRRKLKGGEDVDMLARPDIRTLYLLFILSFIGTTSPSSVKVAFLEQHRDAFTAVFKGLCQDSYSVVRLVLEVCWSGLWSDSKLKRTLKIQVFSESTLSQLLRLYERNVPEGPDPESVPADVVHHFFLALCSRPGVGLCFADRGWYPRETDEEQRGVGEAGKERAEVDTSQKGGKIYNKILANVVKTLKVNEDPRQQELALKILLACPELVTGYWASTGLALEPRLSSKWLANVAFFGVVVSLPVPTALFFFPESGSTSRSLYRPSPPPLSTIVDNIIPTAHIKTHLSRGLQSTSPLVQHASALALSKCLLKYEQVAQAFGQVIKALEEDEEGLWTRRCREVEREMRKRVPDFQVIVGFSQRHNDPTPANQVQPKDYQKQTTPNPIRTALLAESAHRLLWLYHQMLPSVVAEARFDAGKLLQAIEDMLAQNSSSSPTAGLDTLRQLHILRLLKESEHFSWSGKSGSKHGNFYLLLKAYIVTSVPAVGTAIVALLRHILAPGVLFQHDPDEIMLWLDSLPLIRRTPDAKAPDGTPLTDEGDSVISFIDDCVQRCVKTPYKYVEELQAFDSAANLGSRAYLGNVSAFPSPLLATVVEQLGAKLRGRLLTPSDALALFTFVRKLLVLLVGKLGEIGFILAVARQVSSLVEGPKLYFESPTMAGAIRREVALLESSIKQLLSPVAPESQTSSTAVEEYVAQLQTLSEAGPNNTRAYTVVDWLRLTRPSLSIAELAKLLKSLETCKLALKEFCQYLDPRAVSLWKSANLPDGYPRISNEVSFQTLFLHCTNGSVCPTPSLQTMVDSLLCHYPDVAAVKRGIRLILLRLSHPDIVDEALRDWLLVLAEVITALRSLDHVDVQDVTLICVESETTKSLCSRTLNDIARTGFDKFLAAVCKVSGGDIADFFVEMTARWVSVLRESLHNIDENQRDTALMWFKYLTAQDAISLLEYLSERADHSSAAATHEIIDEVFATTSEVLSSHLDAVTLALPLLCRLQSHVPHSPHLTSLIASATQGSLPLAHDGYLPPSSPFSEWSVASVTPSAEKRWSHRLQPVPSIDVESLLSRNPLSDSVVDIVTSLLYRRRSARSPVLVWLRSPASRSCSTTHLVRLFFAVYDSDRSGDSEDLLQIHFSQLIQVVLEARHPHELRVKASQCVVMMLASSQDRAKYLRMLHKEIASTAPEQLRPYVLLVATGTLRQIGTEARPLAEELLDLGLKWAVRHFAENESSSDDDRRMLVNLVLLINAKVDVKSHLAEPVIATVVQDRLSSGEAMRFARLLAASTHLKPVTVNRLLQTVVQHAKFYVHCAPTVPTDGLSSREDSVHFLHTLFHLHPTNTCQPSHIEPLRKIYGGTLGQADRRILSILQLFEATRKTSVASLFAQWSTATDNSSSNILKAIQSLDPSRIFKTCLEYPHSRKLDDMDENAFTNDGIYDPVFILLLFAQMLAERTPQSALDWVQLFRTNVVSLILCTLSAKDSGLREAAWGQVAALYRALENADVQEKPHILHTLRLLKELTPSEPLDETARLPAYTTLLLAHAFRGIFYPSNFIYPLTARFLLQRPTLDPSDVPMLFGMLYSASDDWKKERAWIVRFLSDGIVGTEEWRILKRRHTWDLLASLFQSEGRDRALRRGVLEVLANVTCNARSTTSLVLRHALFAWIEMQVQTMHSDEAMAWVRILENIFAVVNVEKVEAATGGEWRAIASRCLWTILHHPACSLDVFVASVPGVLRFTLLPGRSTAHIPALLTRSLSWLIELEKDVPIPASGSLIVPFQPNDSDKPSVALHRSHQLFDPRSSPSIEVWGECIEALWRVSMLWPEHTQTWDAITSRVLIWRSIADVEGSPLGEWVRREAVESLQTDL